MVTNNVTIEYLIKVSSDIISNINEHLYLPSY